MTSFKNSSCLSLACNIKTFQPLTLKPSSVARKLDVTTGSNLKSPCN